MYCVYHAWVRVPSTYSLSLIPPRHLDCPSIPSLDTPRPNFLIYLSSYHYFAKTYLHGVPISLLRGCVYYMHNCLTKVGYGAITQYDNKHTSVLHQNPLRLI